MIHFNPSCRGLMRSMSKWPRSTSNSGLDDSASALMHLIILLDPGVDKRRSGEVVRAQNAFIKLLLRHLKSKYGDCEAQARLRDGMRILQSCREARMIKERLWSKRLSQQTISLGDEIKIV